MLAEQRAEGPFPSFVPMHKAPAEPSTPWGLISILALETTLRRSIDLSPKKAQKIDSGSVSNCIMYANQKDCI